ncbi:patatin-like phospholipase family protein (plasmid) [Flagellatimonas centrodinii]|uniref:patatin-like phospholipase family protein n=1 Tax=Flagellatimonas centrodinii TaxID=2806210 RepID=UPI001FF063FF|nr:patatin-like phospholipase family protein [Flagellatimonas centrodinii]ULQ48318.1 patatin-like phospholipase family protein [Flagellatimonas centrodinii]
MQDGKESLYLILEGGGAKGIAHIGAIHAIEAYRTHISLSGIAGTSAGSIVAALSVAGYSADEIFSLDGSTHILQNLRPPPRYAYELLGRAAWERLRVIRWCQRKPRLAAALLGLPALWILGALLPPEGPCDIAILAAITAGLIWLFRNVTGLTSLREFRGHLGVLLDAKAAGHTDVTFKQAKEMGWLPLKVIASDLTHRRLAVFSAETTPDVVIADAVMASIAIPVVFEPWNIIYPSYDAAPQWVQQARERQDCPLPATHADGGMIANLPAWAFEAERALDRDSTLLAVELTGAHQTATTVPLTGHGLLASLIHTAIFGAGEISKRVIGRNLVVTLESIRRDGKTGLGVLDFDAPVEDLTYVMQDARKMVSAVLVRKFGEELSAFRRVTQTLHDALKDKMRQGILGITIHSGDVATVRVSVVGLNTATDKPGTRPEGVQCSFGDYSGSLSPGSGFAHIQRLATLVATSGSPALVFSGKVYRPNNTWQAAPNFLVQDGSWSELCWAYAVPWEVDDRCWVIMVESSNHLLEPQRTAERIQAAIEDELEGDA